MRRRKKRRRRDSSVKLVDVCDKHNERGEVDEKVPLNTRVCTHMKGSIVYKDDGVSVDVKKRTPLHLC